MPFISGEMHHSIITLPVDSQADARSILSAMCFLKTKREKVKTGKRGKRGYGGGSVRKSLPPIQDMGVTEWDSLYLKTNTASPMVISNGSMGLPMKYSGGYHCPVAL